MQALRVDVSVLNSFVKNLGGTTLPNLLDGDTLSFTPNRESFQYGGAIWAGAISMQFNL